MQTCSQLVNATLEWAMYIVNDACTQTQMCMQAHMHSQTLYILITNNDLVCICNINCRNAEVMIACMWCDIMKQNMSIALIWFTTKCLLGGSFLVVCLFMDQFASYTCVGSLSELVE